MSLSMEGDGNNVDSNYLQFVVGLLDDTDNYSDFVGRERADSISEFLKRERADSITDFLRRERQDSITDFLPKQSDFLMRDRAFSWDLTMEEQMHSDKAKGIVGSNGQKIEPATSSSSSSGNSSSDNKRKLETKPATATNKSQKTVKSPPIPVKSGSKPSAAQVKPKPPVKVQPHVDYSIKRAKVTHPPHVSENKYVPPKIMDQYNMDMSKMVPGAMLGQAMPHNLTQHGQPPTLTRYDPFSVHLLDHTGMMPTLHPMDASSPRVGAYTKEERQAIIAKFRAKKMRRVWRKQIKYDCRKRLADTRPRVKGRFVSRKERESQAAAAGKDGDDAGSGDGEYDDE